MITKVLASLFLFQTSLGASATYTHLSKEKSDRLMAMATNVCEKTLAFANENKLPRLLAAHRRHCVERKPPSLQGLVVAFYHLGLEVKKYQDKDRHFFRTNFALLAAAVRATPDFPEPKVSWFVTGVIDELSSLALDKKRNLLWSLGDSGTGAFIGKTTVDGFKTEKLQLDGATNHDWEAIVVDASSNVWVLDVGDNLKVRKKVKLYQFNPDEIKDGHVKIKRSIDVTYKDGARDVEAAIADDNKIYLFEKTYYQENRIATVDISDKSSSEQVAKPFGTYPPLGPVTDATLTPDGKLLLLTYFGINELIDWRTLGLRTLKMINDQILGQTEAMATVNGKVYVGREDGKVFSEEK